MKILFTLLLVCLLSSGGFAARDKCLTVAENSIDILADAGATGEATTGATGTMTASSAYNFDSSTD